MRSPDGRSTNREIRKFLGLLGRAKALCSIANGEVNI